MRVVLDTNVVVSAIGFGGALAPILTNLRKRQFVLVMSDLLLLEYQRALEKPRVKLTPLLAARALNESILPFTVMTSILGVKVEPKPRDPLDDHVLATAMAGKADFLVSGDKDLLALKGKFKFEILTPGDFVKRLKL